MNNDIIMTHSQNNFLKKGNGVGGGKTILEIIPNLKQINKNNKNVQSRINSIPKNNYYSSNNNKDNDPSSMNSKNKNKNKKKDKYEILLSNCL
jgi:hypothetical protein